MSRELPAEASVVVIGGGVMGCSTLYHLARDGVGDAILIERNKLTSGTTWHSAAQVRALRSTRNLTDLIRYSVSLYAGLEAETGQQTGWINKGSLSIATTPDRLTHIRRQEGLANLFGVRAEYVTAAEALARWPLMNADDVLGAVWSPDDGRVSPSDLCAALAKGARSRGASIFEDTGVTGILTERGRIRGVETTRGRVRCDAIALCTGLWSRQAAAMAGVVAPVWPCEHFYLLTRPVEGMAGNLPTLSDHDGHLYIRDDSGGLLVGCFEPLAKPVDPERIGEDAAFQLLPEDWDHFEPMMLNALHRIPALESAEVKMLLNGPESFTPDGSFLLGEAAETRGLFLGCGMNSVGVATGGGAGMALAHCIQHGHTPVDLHEADPKRFPDCLNSVEALSARAPEVLGKHYEISYPGRQWSSARNLRQSPVQDRWRAAGACFGQFYGWERPLYFGPPAAALTFGRPPWFDDVRREVMRAHEGAALFDQSTLGKIDVIGPDAAAFLDRVCANRMDRPPGRAIYTLMLNERGGIEADLTAIRLADDHYRLMVGSGAIRRDLAWLRRHAETYAVTLSDVTEDLAIIALMGPAAADTARSAGAEGLDEIGYFHAAQVRFGEIQALATRLSYVGESGWEITCKAEDAVGLLDVLTGAGAAPAGLYAQTSMRIEKGFAVPGHEMGADTSPLDIGLGFSIDWEKDFIGADRLAELRADGPRRRLISLMLADEAACPTGDEPVLLDGKIIGQTTSAAFGHRVGGPVALASVSVQDADIVQGMTLQVDIAREFYNAEAHMRRLFDPEGDRMRA